MSVLTDNPRSVVKTLGPVRLEPLSDGRFLIHLYAQPEDVDLAWAAQIAEALKRHGSHASITPSPTAENIDT